MPQGLNASHCTNRLLAVLEPEDFAALAPHLELVELTRGQILYDAGALISHAYFPHNAIISLVNVMEDGAINEVAVLGRRGPAQCPGDAGGLWPLCRADGRHRGLPSRA